MKKNALSSSLIIIMIAGLSVLLTGPGCGQAQKNEKSAEAVSKPASDQPCLKSFFTKSLHFTGEGMRYWYEEEGGFMDITGIPYNQLGCKSCHVKSCDSCHAQKKNGSMNFSVAKTRSIDTCTKCHSREKLSFKFDKKQGITTAHMDAGLVCADCHLGSDVHGDGTMRSSMRSAGAVQADCEDCHVDQAMPAPELDTSLKSHTVHKDKLDCAACHVSNTMACLNCHFDTYLETGKKKGNFIPTKQWTLLVNYQGQVTSGSAMTLVHQNRKFLAYVPYFTHSVMPQGRQCNDCHMNQAVSKMKNGQPVDVTSYSDGEVKQWSGVIPVMPDKLNWTFFNKTDKGWEPVPNDEDPKIQFGAYGKPLTQKQFKRLCIGVSPETPDTTSKKDKN